MPEAPNEKAHAHPYGKDADAASPAPVSAVLYAELEATTNFTFLTGASHPEELVKTAAALGHRAVAVTDTHSLAGIVRAHVAAKQAGIQLIVGARIVSEDGDGLAVLLYPTTRPAYASLCRLLTTGKRRAEKGACKLTLSDLETVDPCMLAVVVPPEKIDMVCVAHVKRLRELFDNDRLSIAASRRYHQDDADRIATCVGLAERVRVPLVATNAVCYHSPERRALQDVLTCIRHGVTIEQLGFRRHANAERFLKPAEEMARIFRDHPRAIARTLEIADRCKGFSLDQLKYEYPDEVVPPGRTPMEHLRKLTWKGARKRYPGTVPAKVVGQIEHELTLIEELNYPNYFLTVEEIVSFAESRGILCQGRGAAANSAVCYCLGVTAVDPSRVDMLFERFISKERSEPPDIDIDFEHERREEVIQHLYEKYGRDRAALTAEVISYRGKSAVRDVGKAMGLPLDLVGMLAKDLDWWSDTPDANIDRLKAMGLNPHDPHLRMVLGLASDLMGFPRHLSQHVGGFVITRTPLSELVPVENAAMIDRTVIEWDKDDIEAMGMLKVDVLGLGMLSCIRKALELIERSECTKLTLATVPPEDPAVYDMICDADTIGVFQIESRAQMSMLPRLRPRNYYDLVIEVAIVRPGPIQGQMVHPYLKRRSGQEPLHYASPEIERVLSRTLGVPLFQEQAMSMAIVAAGFTPGEADQLRRAMASWKRSGDAIKAFECKLIDGMIARGHPPAFAAQVFQQISGFSGYGFPESHAASFALLVYVSAWLKKHKPAAFAAALINSQPMGFYQPAQIVRDAQAHGVAVLPVDVNRSDWDCTLEEVGEGQALRLGMRVAKGVPQAEAEKIMQARQEGGRFPDVLRLWRRSGTRVRTLNRLAEADGFASLGLRRREALWAVQALKDEPLPLFEGCELMETPAPLPRQSAYGAVAEDYRSVGLSLKAHPLSFVRDQLAAKGVLRNADLADEGNVPNKQRVTVAGLVLVRQRPGTASGIVFFTIEDETGVANLIVRPRIYERFRRVARHCPVIAATGTVERTGKVVHILVRSIREVRMEGNESFAGSRDFH